MSNPLLIEVYYERMIHRSEDVPRLNELILQLAVQGKLVAQDPDDEPASELLKRIETEKQRLIKEKQIKKSKPLPEIEEDERPFDLPDGWEWVRLGEIGDWGSGATPSRRNPEFWNGAIPWLKTGELNDGYIDESEEKITEMALKKTSVRLNQPGDILIAMYGATIGKLGILNIEATTNQACCACTPFSGVFNRYLFFCLRAKREEFRLQGAGGAQPNISKQKIVNTPFALPPLAEQKRIVARVDALLAQTRQLEAALVEAEQRLADLHSAATRSLLAAADVDEFEVRWQFIVDNFDALYDEGYSEAALANVADLKQTILQLAVQGKLTRQDPADEPASALLERIAAEKERLIKAKEIRKSKPLPEIGEEERPYALPEGWEWVRLENICVSVTDGTHYTPKYVEEGMMFLSARNIKPYKFMPEDHKLVSHEDYLKYIQKAKPELNDILLTRVGAGIGEAAIVDQDLDFAIYVSLGLLKLFHEYIHAQYILHWLNSPDGTTKSISNTLGRGTSQGNLNLSLMRGFVIPLPPLAEQKRIVARVDGLLSLCDELAGHLREAQVMRVALREAVLGAVG